MSAKHRISSFTVIVAFLCVAICGVALIPLLPVKLAPSRTLPGMTIRFSMPNHSARVVEMEATTKLESMLSRIKGVKSIHSTSGNGWGSVTIDLDKHASIEMARFEASTIIRQTWPRLPEDVSYPQLTVRHSDEKAVRPFMVYTINSSASPSVIQQHAERWLKPPLSELNGIYKIEVQGATPMEWQLTYDTDQLQSAGVSQRDLREAIRGYYRNEYLGMGEMPGGTQGRQWLRLLLSGGNSADRFRPELIVVKSNKGSLIRLDQLVSVVRTEKSPTSYYRINGLNSIYLSLTAEEMANQLKLSSEVKQLMKKLQATLPSGYEVHNSYDASEYIDVELNKIYLRTGLTVLILLLFVLLITRNLRYLFLIVVTLAINLSISVIFYCLLGLEIQLYSLAGITISLSLIIDNAIIMTDHLMHQRDRRVFLPLLAATMTTVGALSIIFFLDEKIRLNLQDFSAVVMINLMVSLAIALFFVPALVEKIGLRRITRRRRARFRLFSPKRFTVWYNRCYARMIQWLLQRRWIPLTAMVLLFGLPLFLMPDKIEKESWHAKWYNKVFDNSTYKESVKPHLHKWLGGTLRLFTEKVSEGGYFNREGELVLTITASMPNGTTLTQMNDLIVRMEKHLSGFPQIRQFQTTVSSPLRASIRVFFTKEAEHSAFPYQLKNEVVTKALQLGGGSWGVYGLPDQGFSNDVREQAGRYRVKFYGYNYDELTAWTDTLKARLLTYRRIKEVMINSSYSWYKEDYREFFFRLDGERLAVEGLRPQQLYGALAPLYARNIGVGAVMVDGEREEITLNSLQARTSDIWALRHAGIPINGRLYRLDALAAIEKQQMPQKVEKENQQYRLVVQYDYIGSTMQGDKVLEREVEALQKVLPMGYTVERDSSRYWWYGKKGGQYHLIALLVLIIFFTSSVLFNSLRNPFVIILLIPLSFIGVFITFYWFKLNFDQGGFASFILLSGITVNAGIYLLYQYRLIRKERPSLTPLQAYIKAWNNKIVPIFLTVVSTILGFIPFMVGGRESFWFPLAAGTIGGLIMSMFAIWLILPLMIVKRTRP